VVPAVYPSGTVISLNGGIYVKTTPAGVVTNPFATNSGGAGGLVVDSSGNIYCPTVSNTVNKTTPAGVTNTSWATLPAGAILGGAKNTGIAIDSSDNLYTANAGSNNISKITPAGVVTNWANNGAPSRIVADSLGNVYAIDPASESVLKYNSANGTLLATYALAGGCAPQDIGVDGSNNVYTINDVNKTVTKITPAGVVTQAFATLVSAPYGPLNKMAVTSAGTIYILREGGTGYVSKVTSTGTVTNDWSSGYAVGAGGSSESAIAVDSSGNVYVASNNTNTYKYDSTGTLVATYTGTGSGVYGTYAS
jgi:hypothetical protein